MPGTALRINRKLPVLLLEQLAGHLAQGVKLLVRSNCAPSEETVAATPHATLFKNSLSDEHMRMNLYSTRSRGLQ